MAKYTRTLLSLIEAEIEIFPENDLPDFETFFNNFINTYMFREISTTPTEKWVMMFQAKFNLLLPFYKERYLTVNHKMDLFINHNITTIEAKLQNNLHNKDKEQQGEHIGETSNRKSGNENGKSTGNILGSSKGDKTDNRNEVYSSKENGEKLTVTDTDTFTDKKDSDKQTNDSTTKTDSNSNENVDTSGSSNKNTNETTHGTSTGKKRFSDTPQTDILNTATISAMEYDTDFTRTNETSDGTREAKETMSMNEDKDTSKNSTENQTTHSELNTNKQSDTKTEENQNKKETSKVDFSSNNDYNGKEQTKLDNTEDSKTDFENFSFSQNKADSQWQELQKYKEMNATKKNENITKVVKGLQDVLPDEVVSLHLKNIYNVHQEFIEELNVMFMGVY